MRLSRFVSHRRVDGFWVTSYLVGCQIGLTIVNWSNSSEIHYSYHYCPYFRALPPQKREAVMSKYIRRAVDTLTGRPSAGIPNDPEFAKRYPALWEYLTEREWEKGKPRERATLTVFVDEDEFKLSFNDRGNQRSAFITAGTFSGLLDALEQGLKEDDLGWRKYDASKSKYGRK